MKTIRRLIYGEVLAAFGFVTLGFLALFFFFDFVDEMQDIGRQLGQRGLPVPPCPAVRGPAHPDPPV